ncbi:MAG: YigZ family protein [Caldilinea sp.]|uniref:YigZ family protein n=1 Tax=Caldilinea sp. TaxID=2293560 RepID=UPI002BB74047|nr:YigZ family protein [Anaerolineales bacterium]HQY92359.1 YigZ family protein [Caldilinea sp.]
MSSDRYLTPAAMQRVEEEIKRSRFVTTLAHAPTLEAARACIAGVRDEFPTASHNCWAYVVGPPGSTSQIGMSDDGEPHGSAGRPMLTVLLHAGVGDIVAVVTRYFGGTLLGVGGLVRAYSGGVQLALATLPTVERVPTALLDVVIDYAAITPFQRLAPDFEAVLVHQEFGLDASYRVKLPLSRIDAFRTALAELTNGQALVEIAPSE